jgi:hypothetical protein
MRGFHVAVVGGSGKPHATHRAAQYKAFGLAANRVGGLHVKPHAFATTFLDSWRCRNATYPRTAHYKDSTVSVAHKLVVVEVGRLPSCRFPHPSSSPL